MVFGTTIGRGTRGGGQGEGEVEGEGQGEGTAVVMGGVVGVVVVVRGRGYGCGVWREDFGKGGRCSDPRFMHAPALALGATQACMYLSRLGWIGWWRMRRPAALGARHPNQHSNFCQRAATRGPAGGRKA